MKRLILLTGLVVVGCADKKGACISEVKLMSGGSSKVCMQLTEARCHEVYKKAMFKNKNGSYYDFLGAGSKCPPGFIGGK